MALSSKRTRLTEEALEKVHKLIDSHGGIVKKEEFADIDVDYRRILDFVESGELVRIKNGYYTDRMDRFSEEELIARLFPDACLCMESAPKECFHSFDTFVDVIIANFILQCKNFLSLFCPFFRQYILPKYYFPNS